ncbi:MAG: hypothetical protein CMM01_18105 [Rhodopirellula sp.]|nr:hypothetical protein [Rhodopirellula sp.]
MDLSPIMQGTQTLQKSIHECMLEFVRLAKISRISVDTRDAMTLTMPHTKSTNTCLKVSCKGNSRRLALETARSWNFRRSESIQPIGLIAVAEVSRLVWYSLLRGPFPGFKTHRLHEHTRLPDFEKSCILILRLCFLSRRSARGNELVCFTNDLRISELSGDYGQ